MVKYQMQLDQFRCHAVGIAMQQAPDAHCRSALTPALVNVTVFTVGGLIAQGKMTISIYRYSTLLQVSESMAYITSCLLCIMGGSSCA